jgi:hypothetical protein
MGLDCRRRARHRVTVRIDLIEHFVDHHHIEPDRAAGNSTAPHPTPERGSTPAAAAKISGREPVLLAVRAGRMHTQKRVDPAAYDCPIRTCDTAVVQIRVHRLDDVRDRPVIAGSRREEDVPLAVEVRW